jgi:hypothetical protein
MNDVKLNNIPDNIPEEIFDKVLSALEYNVKAMGKDIILESLSCPNERLYEIYFNLSKDGEITEDYYNLMRSAELEENESPDEFNLIYYDRSSIINYMSNFSTMSDSFLVELRQQYEELSDFYKTFLGVEITSTKPETLEDMIDSMYYDGDNYFLRAVVGDDNYYTKMMILADPMLNIETKTFFFKFRYFIGHDQYANFEEMKAGFISKYVTLPKGEIQEHFWKLPTNNDKKEDK